MNPDDKKVPEFEQTLTEKITKHNLIQPVVQFTDFSCQHSYMPYKMTN